MLSYVIQNLRCSLHRASQIHAGIYLSFVLDSGSFLIHARECIRHIFFSVETASTIHLQILRFCCQKRELPNKRIFIDFLHKNLSKQNFTTNFQLKIVQKWRRFQSGWRGPKQNNFTKFSQKLTFAFQLCLEVAKVTNQEERA